jgi:spore germination cell wall hydrolase CwlJ-like protein
MDILPLDVEEAARTAWAEARGCGTRGMQAVINVMVNRSHHPRWRGWTLTAICLEPMQFSCRNPGDPNRAKLLSVTEADPQYAAAVKLAQAAVAGTLPDLTDGADSYYARSLHPPPYWAKTARPTYADPCHLFFVTDPAGPVLTADELNAAEYNRLRNTSDRG